MSKCIKCGRELTSAEIPEFYNGMCEKCYKEKNYAEYPFKQGINDYQNQLDQLKQQLEEKGKEINIKNNKLCELKKQLQNCQNEIIRLKASNKNLMSVIWKTKRERANKGRQVCQSQNESIKYKKLLNKSGQNQKLLAIQELEKTLNFIENVFDKALKSCSLNNGYYDQILDFIDQQIKEIKGEKDVED